jgi:uncharacterized protein (TIGR03435 family)
MTRHLLSTLAIALLERLVPDSDALAGDLIEDFEQRRSRAWLWWQVLAAIAMTRRDRADDIRPLRLVDLQPVDAVERSRRLSLHATQVNLTASPLNDVGGLGILLFAVLLTQVATGVWWVLLASIVAGTVLGVWLIARHRGRMVQHQSFVFDGLLPRSALPPAVLMLLLCATTGAAAQTAASPQGDPSRPSFEVTSVKPSSTGGRSGAIQPGRFAQSAVTVRQLVRMAYGTNEIVGGPGWIDADRFDVEGRGRFDLSGFVAGPDGSAPRVYLMLQQLLEDRFKLVVHKATQERPVYALVVARRDQQLGQHLQRSTFDCDAHLAATVKGGRLPASPPSAAMPRCSVGGAPGQLTADSIDMSQLANVLTASTDRVVLNRTELNGRFNVELQWTPDFGGPPPGSPNANAAATDAPPTLVTAIQEQLGLKLEPTTAPIEVLVIDGAERPMPN